ncbi:MAG: squalene synthase HpnC [Deltaproteobacteria bacterium]|nr:squalene synthase HpnC [Deltaproteobacteria bacterium]
MTAAAVSPAEAFAHCRTLTHAHYENFPVASRLIPKSLRQHVCNIYAFARTADDFADEAHYAGQRLDRLREWRAMLFACARGEASHPIFVALGETIRACALPVDLLNDLITAFAMDCEKRRYATFAEVLHYCRHSANPVGRLILHLFGYVNERWMTLSDHICTALQLANFWQDVAVDIRKDRIYLPQDEMVRFGVREADLAALPHDTASANLRRLIQFQCERTRALFHEGRELCTLVPLPRLRWELKLTWLGGATILDKIAANEYDVACRPTLGPWDWARLLIRSWRWKPMVS